MPLSGGAAYFAAQRRCLGISLQNTKIVVVDDQGTFHRLESEQRLPTELSELIMDSMEEGVREKADLFIDMVKEHAKENAHLEVKRVKQIGVAMAHYGRPNLLVRALQSIASQTRLPDEVVVADDGSPEDIQEKLDEIEKMDWPFPLHLMRLPNRSPGAARNMAWRQLSTSHVMFMDDDNIAGKEELAIFEQAMNRTKADILTTHMQYFSSEDEIESEDLNKWLPIGGNLSLGLCVNLFGDTNFFAERAVLEKLGGFPEEPSIGYEDWALFISACFQGFRIEVVPKVLFNYYRSGDGRLVTRKTYDSLVNVARPAFQKYTELDKFVQLAKGMLYQKLSPDLDTATLWKNGAGRK